MTYNDFIEKKKHNSINYGIDTNFMCNSMFDFQKYIAEYAIKKGRCAIFLDTGLGKTIIELVIATNYKKARHLARLNFNKPKILQFLQSLQLLFLKPNNGYKRDQRFLRNYFLVLVLAYR